MEVLPIINIIPPDLRKIILENELDYVLTGDLVEKYFDYFNGVTDGYLTTFHSEPTHLKVEVFHSQVNEELWMEIADSNISRYAIPSGEVKLTILRSFETLTELNVVLEKKDSQGNYLPIYRYISKIGTILKVSPAPYLKQTNEKLYQIICILEESDLWDISKSCYLEVNNPKLLVEDLDRVLTIGKVGNPVTSIEVGKSHMLQYAEEGKGYYLTSIRDSLQEYIDVLESTEYSGSSRDIQGAIWICKQLYFYFGNAKFRTLTEAVELKRSMHIRYLDLFKWRVLEFVYIDKVINNRLGLNLITRDKEEDQIPQME